MTLQLFLLQLINGTTSCDSHSARRDDDDDDCEREMSLGHSCHLLNGNDNLKLLP